MLISHENFKVVFPVLLSGDMVLSSEHLGPSYLSAFLAEKGYFTKIIEAKEVCEELVQQIVAVQPKLIGISLNTVNLHRVSELGQALKSAMKSVHITVGGSVATFKGKGLFELEGWDFLDSLVRGDGEIPMFELAEAIRMGKDLSEVPSLIYKKEGIVRSNDQASVIHNLDELPFPSREQFEDNHGRLPYLRLATSRGCTSRCTFCNAPHAGNNIFKNKVWRGRTPENIVDEIEFLVGKYKMISFDFVDSTFEDPGKLGKQRIYEIANGIAERGLRIYYNCCMQAKNWGNEDLPLLKTLAKSGLEKVLVGIESGSQRELSHWKKRSTMKDNQKIIKLLRSQKIYVAFGFIMFHPHATYESLSENAVFLKEQLGHNFRRFITRLELYPGAEIIDILERENLLLPEYHKSLNPYAYLYLNSRIEKLAKCLSSLFGETYLAGGEIKKEPSVFSFETYDIELHNFYSRSYRLFKEDAVIQILSKGEEEVESIRGEMAEYNYEFFMNLMIHSQKEMLEVVDLEELSTAIEKYYAEKIIQLRKIQMRVGMAMRRAGCNLNSITNPSI